MKRKRIRYSQSKRSREKDYSIKNMFFFIVLTMCFVFILNARTSSKSGSGDRLNILSITDSYQEYPKTLPDLSIAIRKRIAKEPGSYSVRYVDLTNSEAFGINDDVIVVAASVNKIPILAALYYLADRNEIDLDETVTVARKDVQNWGTGSIRYDPPGTKYTIGEIAKLLVKKSDNTAGFVLAYRIIGENKLQSIIDGWELNHTDIKGNKTTNKDMAKLMRMMYRGDIVSSPLKEEMLSFLENTDFEERLPKLLPKDVPVYHKIGNEVRVTHDVGVVDLEGKPYYIGVLGTDIPDHQKAMEVIADISKLVFEYQKQK